MTRGAEQQHLTIVNLPLCGRFTWFRDGVCGGPRLCALRPSARHHAESSSGWCRANAAAVGSSRSPAGAGGTVLLMGAVLVSGWGRSSGLCPPRSSPRADFSAWCLAGFPGVHLENTGRAGKVPVESAGERTVWWWPRAPPVLGSGVLRPEQRTPSPDAVQGQQWGVPLIPLEDPGSASTSPSRAVFIV